MPAPKRERERERLYEPPRERQSGGDKKPEQEPLFLRATRFFSKIAPSFGRKAEFTQEQQEAFSFLEWDVSPKEFRSAYFGILFLFLGLALVVGGISFFAVFDQNPENPFFMALVGIMLLAAVVAPFVYSNYPKQAAGKEKLLALAYVPEIVNYLTMSLRLTPNLEKAVEFAANHGQGKIAEELKEIVWDLQLGRYESVEEALDELAYKWGPYNEDFKQALMLIRASVLEGDAKKREDLLTKANADVLEGAREKMDVYARNLQQPTVYLYYFGILLPLLLAIILPIGGAFANIALAKAEYLLIAYNLFLPLLVFAFGSFIVSSRPPTYVPPDVPENHPGLPPRGSFKLGSAVIPAKTLGVIFFVLLLSLGFLTDQGWTQNQINSLAGAGVDEGLVISGTLGTVPDFLDEASRAEAIASLPHFTFFDKNALGLGPLVLIPQGTFIGQFTIFGLLIGFSLLASLWLLGEYFERKRVQDEIRFMESEFQDALYVLASRLGENKPIEEALRSSVQFLPKSRIGKDVFKRILENITLLGMTLDAAVFDKTFGVLKNLPSRTIRSGLQFMIDAVQLGVNVAAKSLIGLSMQLRNAQKTDQALRALLADVTTMLKTMSVFVAPIVLGVVSALQRIIVNSLSQQSGAGSTLPQLEGTGAGGFSGLTKLFSQSDALKSTADPATFVFIMGVYVIQVVAILTYFNSQIEDTNNKLHTYVSIAKALPIAILLYCAVVFFSANFIGAIVG
ncbi:MAG: type II secretion system F family protein [Candidatus Norongarragalinales archaeon]